MKQDPEESVPATDTPPEPPGMEPDDLGDVNPPSLLDRAKAWGRPSITWKGVRRALAAVALLGPVLVVAFLLLFVVFNSYSPAGSGTMLLIVVNALAASAFLIRVDRIPMNLARGIVVLDGIAIAGSGPSLGAIGNSLGSMGNCKSCGIPWFLWASIPFGALIALSGLLATPLASEPKDLPAPLP